MDSTRRRWADAAVAVGVAAVLAVVVSADQGGGAGFAAYLWAAALGALMFWRRRYSRTVLALTILGLFVYYAEGFPAIGVAVPVAAALYAAAEAGHRAAAVIGATTVLAVSVTFRLLEGQDFRYVVLYEDVGHAALMTAAIMLGELVRARRRIDALTEQQITLEAERRLSAHKQVLSRDLHDSIGHTLTVAAIHTSVAQQEVRRHPDAAAAALDHVSEALAQALDELRATVRELRAGPQPSLRDVESLAETARAAGFHVRTRIEPVDEPEVSAAAYRLVQEAVTNALRHSDGWRITVDVWHASDKLNVRVENDGAPVAAAEDHAGLTGLRERVGALGGHLDAGPAKRGWHVNATLPLVRRRPRVGTALLEVDDVQEASSSAPQAGWPTDQPDGGAFSDGGALSDGSALPHGGALPDSSDLPDGRDPHQGAALPHGSTRD
ncbi:sensor histidine kinase [Actinoplanes sp. NPDC049599]|uniref:sensor histidine kinase n=1 Tax=Actinoplanes sp. NPDC049599 TaxID=3363903 RepID=UPI0037B11FFD